MIPPSFLQDLLNRVDIVDVVGRYVQLKKGGANFMGTVYKIDASGVFTLLHSFTGDDGAYPAGRLFQATDGKLYGTTDDGGAGAPPNTIARGSVFRIDTLGNFEWLASFYADSPPPPPAPLAAALAPDSLASSANPPFFGVTDGHDGFLYRTLAYPYGGHDDRIEAAAEAAGYDAAAILAAGPVGPYHWPRIGVYASDGRTRFAIKTGRATLMVAFSKLGGYLDRLRR